MTAHTPENIYDADLPQSRMLTDEEDRQIKEHLAQRNFGMTLDEFTEAWKASEFDEDQERHGDVMFLAKMLPEYWTLDYWQKPGFPPVRANTGEFSPLPQKPSPLNHRSNRHVVRGGQN